MLRNPAYRGAACCSKTEQRHRGKQLEHQRAAPRAVFRTVIHDCHPELQRLVAHIREKKPAKPVHLVLHGETLYIGAAGTGSILAFDIPNAARTSMRDSLRDYRARTETP